MNERGRRFSHLSWHNRLKIDKMLKEGYKAQEIADALHVHNSTIYREIKRGLTVQCTSELVDREVYCPDTAQRKYEESKSVHGPDLKIGNDHELAAYIEDKILNGHFSPAAALAKINEEGKIFSVTISEWTLYRYIDKGVFLNITNKDLPMHGEHKKNYKKVHASRPSAGDSIEDRPEEIDERTTFGHWEMDCVVSARGSLKRLLVLTERLTRREIIMLMRDGSTASVVRALDKLERKCGSQRFRKLFRTITVDNGSEFADCESMERSRYGKHRRTHVYYCHPYTACERGSNENANRLIRRWLPKGTCFEKLTDTKVRVIETWMNSYPREILGWRSAGSLFDENLKKLA